MILQLCKNIIIDRDSTSTKRIRELEIANGIQIRYDPGHIKKSIINQLLKLFKDGIYEPFAHRVGNWFMRCLKTAQTYNKGDIAEMQEDFKKYWSHTVNHYSTRPCHAFCPCKEQDNTQEQKQEEAVYTFLEAVQFNKDELPEQEPADASGLGAQNRENVLGP